MIANRMKNLNPYVPGEQPKDRVYIKLNANENPYPPSPKVIDAVKKAVDEKPFGLSLYPDPDSNELKSAIASMLNECGGCLSKPEKLPFEVTPEMIYCGNGSDEVLSFLFYAFFDSEKPIVLPEHTYSFYPVYCGFYGIPMEKIPLNSDWTLNKDAILEKSNKFDCPTIFANPNAPTGLGLTRDEVRKMILASPKDQVFVVDEAYVDFGGESCISLLKEFNNLVIVRTFSKSLCGAGMRCGYLVSNPELINTVTTVKNSVNHFPMDFLTQKAGIAACNDVAYYSECSKKVAEERDSFMEFLAEKGWTFPKSKTNFIFATKKGVDGEAAYKAIKEKGILVRHFKTPGIENYIRITVGTKEQMAALRKAMENL